MTGLSGGQPTGPVGLGSTVGVAEGVDGPVGIAVGLDVSVGLAPVLSAGDGVGLDTVGAGVGVRTGGGVYAGALAHAVSAAS